MNLKEGQCVTILNRFLALQRSQGCIQTGSRFYDSFLREQREEFGEDGETFASFMVTVQLARSNGEATVMPPNDSNDQDGSKAEFSLSASASGAASEAKKTQEEEKYTRERVSKPGVLAWLFGGVSESETATGKRVTGTTASKNRKWQVTIGVFVLLGVITVGVIVHRLMYRDASEGSTPKDATNPVRLPAK